MIKDSLKYSYDEKGNISKVFENGLELARYFYDENSRLIRENNKKLDKTFFYEYDKGGNIVRKTSYKYNLNNREAIITTTTDDAGVETTKVVTKKFVVDGFYIN